MINAGNPLLRFAWTPGPDMLEDWRYPFPLELLIEPTQLTFIIINVEDNTQSTCSEDLEPISHIFRVEVNSLNHPLIFVDDIQVCQTMNIPFPSFELEGGRIHFSGNGLVDDVIVDYQP